MEKDTLSMEVIGSENSGHYIIKQLNKDWSTIITNQNEWLYFARACGGEIPWKFYNVDDLCISDVSRYISEDTYMLFMLKEKIREEE